LLGLAFGAMHSARRGMGSDVAGSRPYRPGDDIDAIDWASSAKLSAARGQDEFIVRERYADEAPYVVCVVDRRPEMAHVGPPLPWLSKPDAIRLSIELVTQAAAQARSLVGYVDFRGSEPTWSPPTSERDVRELGENHGDTRRFEAPPNAMSLALAHLEEHRRSLPSGSFVFLFSDFIEAPSEDDWLRAIELRWDIVPVVIQDPVWEQTFPYVDNIAFPFADPRTALRRSPRRERRSFRKAKSVDVQRGAPAQVTSHWPVRRSRSCRDGPRPALAFRARSSVGSRSARCP